MLEIALKTQVQIYELSKFECPGSREDEFAKMLCRIQSKMEGSRFSQATQGAVSNALIKLLDERKANKSYLTIKMVMTVIRDTHTMMNGVSVGRLTDDEPSGGTARAMLAQVDTHQDHANSRQRTGRFNQRRANPESEFNTLKQENAALKNQINQLKENFEKLKASCETPKAEASSKTATGEAGGKRKYGERAKKAVDVPAKPPTPPRARVGGFKILNTGDKHSDDESSGSEDGGERNVRQATGKARANFARVIVCSQPPIAQPIVKSSEITPTNLLEIAVESPQNRVMTRNQARRLVDIAIDEMDGVTSPRNPDQTEGVSSFSDPESESGSDEDNDDDLPELVEEDYESETGEDVVNIPFMQVPIIATPIFVAPNRVTTQLFSDDILRFETSTGRILRLEEIPRGPMYPEIDRLESWAAGDGGASISDDLDEALIKWTSHSKRAGVVVMRKILFLRRVGIFQEYEDGDIAVCTELLDFYYPADAGHTKYELPPVPVWASPAEVAVYKHRIQANL